MTRRTGYSLAALSLALILAGSCRIYEKSAEPARREMVAFAHSLKLGENREEVLSRFRESRFEFIQLDWDEGDLSMFGLPTHFPPSAQWVLYLQWQTDKLVAVRFRSLDTRKWGPGGAPADRVKSGIGNAGFDIESAE